MSCDDKWFATFQHLNRARAEAFELFVEADGDRLVELGTLSSCWNALAEFWQRVRDDDETSFLMREAAEVARIHAAERALYTAQIAALPVVEH